MLHPSLAPARCSGLARGEVPSVDLLHSRAAGPAWRCATPEATTRHAALRHAAATSCRLIHLHHDWVYNALELFLLGLEFVLFGQLVLVQPVQCLLDRLFDLFLVASLKLVLQLLLVQRVPHRETVVLQAVFGLDLHPV